MSDAPELQMRDVSTDAQPNDGDTTSTDRLSPAASAARENRRSLPRRRVERLAYICFDKDNGGILLDIGEGGLKFQGVASSLEGEFCTVKFMLPGSGRTIEVRGQIAWSNKSRKGGGVRFVDIPEEVRQQIREWMEQENTPLISARPTAKPIVSKPPLFLTRERVKAGMTSSPMSHAVMPSLSSAPVVPVAPIVPIVPVMAAAVPLEELRSEGGVTANSHPIEMIAPAARISDAPVESAKVEVPAVLVQAPLAVGTKTPADTFREPAQPTATPRPEQAVAPIPQSTDLSGPATLPRSESFLAADLAALKYSRLRRVSRASQIAVAVAFVCVAAAAVVVVSPRTPALLASFQGISQASTALPVAASEAAAATGRDFSVDAVDSANRHWRLANDGAESSAAVSNDGSNASANVVGNAVGDASSTLSSDGVGNAESDASAATAQLVETGPIARTEPRIKALVPPPAAQHLDLRPPRNRQVASSSFGLEAPSVVENAPSANSLDSRALALVTPSLVAPSLPAPPPDAPVDSASAMTATSPASKSALRPAVLIHSVPAVYPRDISLRKSGSSVLVSAVIDKDGLPGSLTMVGGDPSLLGAAFAAVREYRYDAALLNGEPVASTVVITVNFQQTR
jgi:hypothetical protein